MIQQILAILMDQYIILLLLHVKNPNYLHESAPSGNTFILNGRDLLFNLYYSQDDRVSLMIGFFSKAKASKT